jgi:hypothetical protein
MGHAASTESIHIEAPIEHEGATVPKAPARVDRLGQRQRLRVEEVGGGAETVLFSPALFTNRGCSTRRLPR